MSWSEEDQRKAEAVELGQAMSDAMEAPLAKLQATSAWDLYFAHALSAVIKRSRDRDDELAAIVELTDTAARFADRALWERERRKENSEHG